MNQIMSLETLIGEPKPDDAMSVEFDWSIWIGDTENGLVLSLVESIQKINEPHDTLRLVLSITNLDDRIDYNASILRSTKMESKKVGINPTTESPTRVFLKPSLQPYVYEYTMRNIGVFYTNLRRLSAKMDLSESEQLPIRGTLIGIDV
jgi:hypothetical protein